MKMKFFLTVCLLYIVSISIYGQFTYSHTDKTVTINGTTINKPQQRTSNYGTQSGSSNVDWSQIVTNVIMQKLLAPNTSQTINAPTYYFDGKYYNSRAELDAAIEKFKIEFEKHKQEILADLKGTGQTNSLELKSNPYNVQQETTEPTRLEQLASSLDFKPMPEQESDENSVPIYRHMLEYNFTKDEEEQVLSSMGLDMAVDFVSKGGSFAASAAFGPEAPAIAKPILAGSVEFCTSLAHSAINGEPMDFGIYRNALVSGTGVALGNIPGAKGIVISSVYAGGTTLALGGSSKEAVSGAAKTALGQAISSSLDYDEELSNEAGFIYDGLTSTLQ